MSDDVENSLARMFSRDEVIKCPHMMVLLGYLHRKHDIPKSGWKTPGLRYHYTDATGLMGIIQTGRLWATDIRYLNDPSEATFLPERLLSLMGSKSGGCSDVEKMVVEGIGKAMQNPRSKHSTFCASLSADGDLLSQWRGYGGFGKGYAVGLNLHGSPHPQLAHFYDVIYGDDALPEVARDLLDLFASAATQWKDMMLDEWAATIRAIANCFKDRSYIEEQESRLLCSLSEEGQKFDSELPLKFRTRGSDIVPYVPMSLHFLHNNDDPRLPIERIILGPGVDFERNVSSIASLLKAHSYCNVEIERSKIPFRP